MIHEGYQKCLEHVQSLIEVAQILHQAGKYDAAIPFAILAIEESYKLKLFQKCLSSKMGISKSAWEKITDGGIAHKRKLIRPYVEAQQSMKKDITEQKYQAFQKLFDTLGYGHKLIPLSDAQRYNQIIIDRFQALDALKQHSFYLNWKDRKWSTLKMSLSMEELEAISSVQLFIARFGLISAILWLKFPIIPSPGTAEFEAYRADEAVQSHKKLYEEMDSTTFKNKAAISAMIVDRYIRVPKP